MAKSFRETLTPEKALIFRAIHRSNLPWVLANGLHCRSSALQDPGFVTIGNTEIIARRQMRPVPIEPHGDLADYVPFYFTPRSPMLLNIKTGYRGVTQRANREIVILVSSLVKLEEIGVRYVFTDRHAVLSAARFFSRLSDLDQVDFEILQKSDFRKDENDPGKFERYDAEALVYRHVPVEALLGIACCSEVEQREVASETSSTGGNVRIVARPDWYF